MIRRKFIAILFCMLIVASVFGCMNNITAEETSKLGEDTNFKEISPDSENNIIENRTLPIRIVHSFIPSECESSFNGQEPENPGERPLIYKPPWDIHDYVEEKYEYGVGDCWAENTEATPDYGKTTIHTWAGPGIGEYSITVWLCHGFYFPVAVTDIFTFNFK